MQNGFGLLPNSIVVEKLYCNGAIVVLQLYCKRERAGWKKFFIAIVLQEEGAGLRGFVLQYRTCQSSMSSWGWIG